MNRDEQADDGLGTCRPDPSGRGAPAPGVLVLRRDARRGWAVRVAAGVWLLLVLAWAARLGLEAWNGSGGCELTPGSSIFGTASWGWAPPGVTCTYVGGLMQGPPGVRWVIAAVLLLGGIALGAAALRRR